MKTLKILLLILILGLVIPKDIVHNKPNELTKPPKPSTDTIRFVMCGL